MKTQDSVIDEFNKILSINEKDNEGDIQSFLEENTDLIPENLSALDYRIRNDIVLKKYQICKDYICDFAHISTRSFLTSLVLIELKPTTKKIFTQDKGVKFSSDFNNALDQIGLWKAYLDKHNNVLKEDIRTLIDSIYKWDLTFEYVLVYGRREEISSPEKIDLFNQKNENGIKVITYDTLIRKYKENPRNYKHLMRKEQHGYELLSFQERFSALDDFTKDNLSFDAVVEKKLIESGLDIPRWKSGKRIPMYGTKALGVNYED